MITFEDFLASGYKQHYPHKANRFSQRCIRGADSDGKSLNLYFINVYEWCFRPDIKSSLEIEVEFFSKDEWFTVTLHDGEQKENVKYIEDFFSKIYSLHNCVPDIHNND